MKVFIYPTFGKVDKGDGGVRRVVEAQRRHFPAYGWKVVDSPEEADLLVVHIMATGKLLKNFPDKPLVVHSHGLYWGEYAWEDWAKRANADCLETIRQADAVTAPSEWVAQAIRRATLRRVEVLGHGVELDEWARGKGRPRKDGYVLWNKTRIDPVCDPIDLKRLAALRPGVSILTTFWPDNHPPANVTLVGRQSYAEAQEQMHGAFVYLCTARETFGIGTLEAMAASVPVLGWRWGGQAEIIEHQVTGYLAKPMDFEDLARGLDYCLENRKALGKAARQEAERRYAWYEVMANYDDLYRRVVQEHHQIRPKVSVVVPAYNLEKHLPLALHSLQEQGNLVDWECVVVDDASPDACGTIADSFAAEDSRFRVIHNEKNQYLAGALNTGIAAARGKYILPLDADNILPPNALTTLSAALDGDRSIHVAYGSVRFIEEDGKPSEYGHGPGKSLWPTIFDSKVQLEGPVGANCIPSTAMYRRPVWELTGGYRRRWRTAEDADFWTRATSYGFRAAKVTEADILVYRNREGSMSREETKKDWRLWMPWCRDIGVIAPAGILREPQVPIPSIDPVLISVIIPVGPGHEELYIDALDSVAGQTFVLWECVLINDTGKPLRWVPSWAKLIDTGGGKGVAVSRNLGIRASRGRVFVPLDADDTLEVQALARLYEVWEQFGGVVYSDWIELWEDRPMTTWEAADYRAIDLRKGCIHTVTALYPRSAWEEVGGFDESLPAWEDWDFQIRLGSIGVCGTRIAESLFTYRKATGYRREENYSQQTTNKNLIYERWPDFFQRGELMACSKCPGGGGRNLTRAPLVITPAVAAEISPGQVPDGFVLLEYTGRMVGTINYHPQNSPYHYRFSALAEFRLRPVHKDDLWFFLRRPDFQVVEEVPA